MRILYALMTALLDLPAFRDRVHRLSIEDYHRLGESGVLLEDVELLDGIVVTKIPKSPLHELVVQKLMRNLLAKVPPGFEVRRESPLTLRDSEPEPDLSVVRGKADDWLKSHPSSAHLVVEIAVTSAAIDEGKAAIYAAANIPEYWLVRPEENAVEVFRSPGNNRYNTRFTLISPAPLHCASIPSIQFLIPEILPAD